MKRWEMDNHKDWVWWLLEGYARGERWMLPRLPRWVGRLFK